jgi:SprT-like family
MKQHSVRETWLQDAVRHLEPVFSKAGYAIPPVRVSCGFAASSSPRTTMGQCWPRERSGGGVNEIDDPVQLLDTLVHELCHAVDDCFSGHGEDFKGIAQTVGLEGPARMAHATEELMVKLMMISQELGPYPHQAIVFPPPRPSNASRSKAKCGQCGYEVTLLKKWASYGAPICPKDNIRMQEDAPETIENTSDYDSDSVVKGGKAAPDQIRRAIS